jgi:hypothetical protein
VNNVSSVARLLGCGQEKVCVPGSTPSVNGIQIKHAGGGIGLGKAAADQLRQQPFELILCQMQPPSRFHCWHVARLN